MKPRIAGNAMRGFTAADQWAWEDLGRRRPRSRSDRRSTSDLSLIRSLPLLTDSDKMSEFPEESRHSAGKQFFRFRPLFGHERTPNGHVGDLTPPRTFRGWVEDHEAAFLAEG